MPPPRQDANVTRDCGFYKMLRYFGAKAVESLEKFLCKTKVSDGTATIHPSSGTECHLLPQRGEGIGNYNLINGENQPSPQPSPTGEGVSNSHPELVSGSHRMQQHTGQSDVPKMLKHRGQSDVQHDENNFLKRTYSLINLFTYSPRKRFAFTLAEVLITLGIIGIVAAMTMPALITNYQKQRAVTQLKKSYTNLAEAVKRSELENDTVANWNFDLPAEEFYNTYLSGFLSVNNSTVTKSNIEYKFLNGNTCTEHFCTESSYIAYLADGSSIMISFQTGLHTGRVVSIDINGNKRPNTIGKDLFQFAITKDNGVVPFGYGDFGVTNPDGNKYQNFGNYDRDKITGTGIYACNKDKYGIWCPALIIMDGWTMSKDYPW